MPDLKPCPFCGCLMRLESNRDWHRVMGDHADECVFLDSETMMVPATDEQRALAISDWNRRAIPAGQVLVPRELLERFMQKIHNRAEYDDVKAARAELRALLQP